jgi:hypothetical protein
MASSSASSSYSHSDSIHAFDEIIGRLHRAGVSGVLEIIERVSLRERVELAAFCWQRVHLYEIGLAIAEHCDEGSLIAELGVARGSALYVQAEERRHRPATTARTYHPKVTLAGLGSLTLQSDAGLMETAVS